MEISGIEVSVLKIERMECEKSRDLAAIIINRGFSGVTISNAIFKFGGDKSNGHLRHPVFLIPVSARDCALVLGCTEARNPHDATWVNQSIISNSQVPHPFYVSIVTTSCAMDSCFTVEIVSLVSELVYYVLFPLAGILFKHWMSIVMILGLFNLFITGMSEFSSCKSLRP